MNQIDAKLAERARRKSAKREDKRRQLAESTNNALCALGYANTSLRDIAELSGTALGTLHYYFEDRVDLISYSVRYHKMAFLEELKAAASHDGDLDDVISLMSKGLAEGVTNHADNHKEWFDIRNQSMFDPAFEPVIAEIESSIVEIFSQVEKRFLKDRDDAQLDYAAIDGLFRHIMQSKLPEHRDYAKNEAAFMRLLNYLWRA